MAVCLRDLSFSYRPSAKPVFSNVRLTVAPASRLVLVGSNGAGKTTLLHLIGGRRRASSGEARVLAEDAFECTRLALRVGLITSAWDDDLTLPVRQLVRAACAGHERGRCEALSRALGVEELMDAELAALSEGQRRRVQLFCQLAPRREVVLLDEATNSLDVMCRAALLAFLREESEVRGVTIIFCTHIFDGLDGWATSLAHLDGGALHRHVEVSDLPVGKSIYQVVCDWLTEHARSSAAATEYSLSDGGGKSSGLARSSLLEEALAGCLPSPAHPHSVYDGITADGPSPTGGHAHEPDLVAVATGEELDGAMTCGPRGAGGADPSFEPAVAFDGPRPGKAFRLGPHGVGYYPLHEPPDGVTDVRAAPKTATESESAGMSPSGGALVGSDSQGPGSLSTRETSAAQAAKPLTPKAAAIAPTLQSALELLATQADACRRAVAEGNPQQVMTTSLQITRIWEQTQKALQLFQDECEVATGVRLSPPVHIPHAPVATPGLPEGWGSRHNALPEEALVAKGAILSGAALQDKK